MKKPLKTLDILILLQWGNGPLLIKAILMKCI